MAIPILIPQATITLEEANVLGWRKHEGEFVRKDEIVFEMETDKVVVEVPAPADGTLLRIVVREGPAKVNQPVAWIGAVGEAVPETPPAPGASLSAQPAPSDRAGGGTAAAPWDRIGASPAARRRARELGVDLSRVRGTGPGGRITEADVERREKD